MHFSMIHINQFSFSQQPTKAVWKELLESECAHGDSAVTPKSAGHGLRF